MKTSCRRMAALVVVALLVGHGAAGASQGPRGILGRQNIAVTPMNSPKAVGVRGGVIFVDTNFYSTFGSTATVRPILGGFVRLPLFNRISVQLEAFYLSKGFATTGLYLDGSTVRASYLEFPVLLSYRLTQGAGAVRVVVLAGGFWGHEMACSTVGGVASIRGSNRCDGIFRDRITADLGFIFGGAVEVDVSKRWFLVADGRYHLGMKNLHWATGSDGAASRAVSILGGFGFRLGGG